MEEFAIGTLINSRYRIVDVLDRGGMGVVYVAKDAVLGRDVALKSISTSGLQRPPIHEADRDEEDPIRQFENESMATAKLNNPYVVTVFDAGVHEQAPYLVMELLQGEDLQKLMRKREGKPLEVEKAVTYLLEVCFATAAAHEYQIFHRDLSSSNVYITKYHAKVLDFGLARLRDQPRGTARGHVRGTWQYTAPERFRGEDGQAAGDIYSIGVLLYQTLTGGVPFVDETGRPLGGERLVPAILGGAFPKPRTRNRDLSVELEAIILRAMALKPGERFPSVHQLGRALLPHAPRAGRIFTEHFEGPEPMVQRLEVLTGPNPRPARAAPPPEPDPFRSMAAKVMPFAMSRAGQALDPAIELGEVLLMEDKRTANAAYSAATAKGQNIVDADPSGPGDTTGASTQGRPSFKGTTSDLWVQGDEGETPQRSRGSSRRLVLVSLVGVATSVGAAILFLVKSPGTPAVEHQPLSQPVPQVKESLPDAGRLEPPTSGETKSEPARAEEIAPSVVSPQPRSSSRTRQKAARPSQQKERPTRSKLQTVTRPLRRVGTYNGAADLE